MRSMLRLGLCVIAGVSMLLARAGAIRDEPAGVDGRAFEKSFNRFPGLSYEVQGVYQVIENDRIKFFTYVVKK
jgi:hypothetical protein